MPDSEPVRLWRNQFKLNLSVSWKADVDKTVTDIDLWKSILEGWGYWHKGKWKKKSPAIKSLLDEYERIQFDRNAIQSQRNGVHSTEGIPERATRILPESGMPSLLDRTRM
jgi:hypothetical protein